MIISVVLAAYNGEQFIIEQLDSIKNQSYKPDEVLIIDDCSSDNTYTIIKDYIESQHLSAWELIKNKTNLGWRKTFINGIHDSKGDIIFCCDQDDIWNQFKVEKMVLEMEKDASIGVLACNVTPFYMSPAAERVPSRCSIPYGSARLEKCLFDNTWNIMRRPGCSMCFRRELLPSIDNIWFDEMPHDSAIWITGLLLERAYILNEELLFFRRHASNNSPKRAIEKKLRQASLNNAKITCNRILGYLETINCDNEKRILIEKTLRIIEKRIAFLDRPTFMGAFSLLKELKERVPIKTILGDYYSVLRPKSEMVSENR